MNEFDIPATSLIKDVRHILQLARQKAYSAVNSEMVIAYWQMGRRIVEEEQHGEQKAAYGEAILKTLSISLTTEFGKGFSYANIRNFRQFYLTYPDEEICYAVCSKLSWSHNRLIMRIESPDTRSYYLKECAHQMWSTRTLERNINSHYYQRLLSSQTKQDISIPDQESDKIQANDFIKDPYVFEFLNIPEPINALEQDIEKALIGNLQHFLLELGKGFSFVGRQRNSIRDLKNIWADIL
ncbi:PDDEXK nuclease domain-containing protein [Dyadobacter sp. CY347]|uniref:PDDEXK nuclease domain-containing protein n=1 Tax=Dyadobacter sp. CY347 TaxID=2909336 RepID=UPI001F1808FD|nr:PDDEXK nuclease domain-containing protein [Dyadobacter sp. CY347]MCF2488111.1 PDDEXK nuclease domain-containing protein [Dyadobacter sp. CY347]